MPRQPVIDPVRALVDGYARGCLSDLLASGVGPSPEAVLLTDGNWSVLVAAFRTPTAQGVPAMSDCDRDCLALLAQLQEAMPAQQLCRELEERGIGVWAEITVKRSLARLRK